MLTEELPIYTKALELVKLTRQFLMNMNRIDRIWYGEKHLLRKRIREERIYGFKI